MTLILERIKKENKSNFTIVIKGRNYMKNFIIFFILFFILSVFNSCNKYKGDSFLKSSYKGKSWSNINLEEDECIQNIYDYINISFEHIKHCLKNRDEKHIAKEYEFWINNNKLIKYLLLYFKGKINSKLLKEKSILDIEYMTLLKSLSLYRLKNLIESHKKSKKVFYYSEEFYMTSKKIHIKLINRLLRTFLNDNNCWSEQLKKGAEWGASFSCISVDFYKKLTYLLHCREKNSEIEKNKENFINLREKFHETLYILLSKNKLEDEDEMKIKNIIADLFK